MYICDIIGIFIYNGKTRDILLYNIFVCNSDQILGLCKLIVCNAWSTLHIDGLEQGRSYLSWTEPWECVFGC